MAGDLDKGEVRMVRDAARAWTRGAGEGVCSCQSHSWLPPLGVGEAGALRSPCDPYLYRDPRGLARLWPHFTEWGS